MPGAAHRTDYVVLSVLGAFSVLMLLLLVTLGGHRGDEGGAPWIRTSHTTNTEGALVCYTLFERLGCPVKRIEKPLFSETLDDVDVLFVLLPIVPIQSGEMGPLRRWVRGGGVVVCTPSAADQILGHKEAGKPEAKQACTTGCRPTTERHERSPDEVTHVPAEASELPLAVDVAQVHFQTSCVIGGPDPAKASRSRRPLLKDTQGTRIAVHDVGAGHVVVLADSSFLANGWIGKADNAVVAVNLVGWCTSRTRGSRVGFDEYHFGYGSHDTPWQIMRTMLLETSPGWAVLCLTCAGLLYLVYRGRRFGPRRAPGRPRRRSKLEFVQSVGATYRAAKADRLVLEIIFHWFKRRLAGHFGLAAKALTTDLAAAAARSTGASPHVYGRAFDACEAALARPRLSTFRGNELLKRLAKIEMEVFYGSGARRRGRRSRPR